MRNFTLNEERVDLANNKAIMGVGPCFRVVEPGVYFPGMGYAIYSEYTITLHGQCFNIFHKDPQSFISTRHFFTSLRLGYLCSQALICIIIVFLYGFTLKMNHVSIV